MGQNGSHQLKPTENLLFERTKQSRKIALLAMWLDQPDYEIAPGILVVRTPHLQCTCRRLCKERRQ